MGQRVIIVGGGIVGSSIAYHLAREGVAVTVLERRAIAAEASGASAGGVRQIARHPYEVPFAIASIKRWPTLAQELDAELGYRQTGGMRLARTEAQMATIRTMTDQLRQLGVADLELRDADGMRELVPGLGDDFIGGVYCPSDGSVDAGSATRAFAIAAHRHGARLEIGCQVRQLRVTADRVTGVVVDDGATIDADLVINTAGAWGVALHAQVAGELPVEMRVPQMVVTVPVAERILEPVVAANHASLPKTISLKQLPAGGFMVGGGWPSATGEDGQPIVDRANAREALRVAADVIPAIDGLPAERFWFGREAQTIDDLPVLGPVDGLEGYLVALGFSGHGLAIAPEIGQALADVAVGRPARHPIAPMGVDRFAHGEADAVEQAAAATSMAQPDAG